MLNMTQDGDRDHKHYHAQSVNLGNHKKTEPPTLRVQPNNGLMPEVLPIYRGIHICTPHFTTKFREAFSVDSELIAKILNNQPIEGTPIGESMRKNVVTVFKNAHLYP